MSDHDLAFPIPESANHAGKLFPAHNIGMSLRDYFAAAAVQGLVTRSAPAGLSCGDIEKMAFESADAMLRLSADRARPH